MSVMENCVCGSQKNYADCCGRFINGQQFPATPEELMRSRYTAYTQINLDYIAHTMKSPAADDFDPVSMRQWEEKIEWISLEILATTVNADQGWVEFLAYFYEDKQKQVIHELSEFHRIDGKWYYIDGKQPKQRPVVAETLVGRNDPCPCDSGKKYKKCCGT